MTKAEIVQAIYDRLGGFSKKEAADLVDLVFETMKETLGRGEKIKVSGFGNFVLRDKRQRQGRNPQTGDPILITERRVLSFKASNILRHELNTGEPGASSNGSAANHSAANQSAANHSAANHSAANQSGNGGHAAQNTSHQSASHTGESSTVAARSTVSAQAPAAASGGDAWMRRGSGGSSS